MVVNQRDAARWQVLCRAAAAAAAAAAAVGCMLLTAACTSGRVEAVVQAQSARAKIDELVETGGLNHEGA